MTKIVYTVSATVLDENAVNQEYVVTTESVSLDDESGFTEEQISLLLEEQLDITLGSITDIQDVAETTATDFVP